MSREFDGLYTAVKRPSIPPGRLLRAQLLQVEAWPGCSEIIVFAIDHRQFSP